MRLAWLARRASAEPCISATAEGCPASDSETTSDARWWVTSALSRSAALRAGVALVVAVALAGLLVPLATPYSPDQILPNARLLPPSAAHPFGTDQLGRDLLTRVAYGSHVAARMAPLGVALSLCVGLALGSLAGYYGGWADQLVSRAMDGWMSLPGALVAIVVAARLGASLDNLVVALGVMGVPAFYRIVRSSTLSARRMPYAEAAVALGASDGRVMWRHVFPNILSPVVVLTSMRLGTTLLAGSGLSFIGLGAQPPTPEWGTMLAAGRSYLDTAWWLALFPGLAMTLTVVGLNLLGDGLRDVLDPRLTGSPDRVLATETALGPGAPVSWRAAGEAVSADERADSSVPELTGRLGCPRSTTSAGRGTLTG